MIQEIMELSKIKACGRKIEEGETCCIINSNECAKSNCENKIVKKKLNLTYVYDPKYKIIRRKHETNNFIK